MMALLHMTPPARWQAGATIVMLALADALVLYMFLMRPFRWHDGSTARFMF
jgi:hypothetical protein